MHVLLGCLVAMAIAPSGDPRAIDPAANRPQIIAPGGGAATGKSPPIRTPKAVPEPEPKVASGQRPTVEPKTGPEQRPEVEPTPEPATKARSSRCLPQRGRCWQLNVGGIVAASVGAAMLGTGIGFTQAPQFPVADEPIYNYSLRPPGVVLLAVGTATAVTGVLMIVAGHAVHGRPKPGEDTARLRLVPGGLRW
ncbi:hypothetical protein [Paraliomyxa miuraensis]|uniref:hypothetical protein n=1 Tax=Paraliomyxa miuraensis TaxID=376150 RepID=UPI0022562A75|nr:hypothetical protein [Paraliomyxa miuraensis]MCX4243268.1 hypothetical protein [Paraliomyxa miuraensis]